MDPVTLRAIQLGLTLVKSRRFRNGLLLALVLALVLLLATALAPMFTVSQMMASQRAKKQQQDQRATVACGAPAASGDTSGVSAQSLGGDQIGNARKIFDARGDLPPRAAIVALATAMQESQLKNINYGDRDSVGLFQQRPSQGWGTVAQIMDPTYSATKFYAGLRAVAGWEQMPVTVAAQTVQRSAFPSAYAKHEPVAASLVQQFTAKGDAPTGAALCDPAGAVNAATCAPSGLGIEQGLTPDGLRVLRCVKQQFPQIKSFGGVGDRPANVDDDHQTGRAVDIMVPGRCDPVGLQIRDWAYSKQKELGVKYIIWCDQIWSVARNREGWRPYANPSGGNDTLQHRDHVHISVYGNAAGTHAAASGGSTLTPVERYTLTARFGQCGSRWGNCHTGLDFAAPIGAPVRAVQDGTVTYVAWGGAYGNLTKIKMVSGAESWYAHQSAQTVTPGQQVKAGDQIGMVGATGNVSGPHLHLEIRQGGSAVDPAPWLKTQGVNT